MVIQREIGADKERQKRFREQPRIRSMQKEVTDFHIKIPSRKGVKEQPLRRRERDRGTNPGAIQHLPRSPPAT